MRRLRGKRSRRPGKGRRREERRSVRWLGGLRSKAEAAIWTRTGSIPPLNGILGYRTDSAAIRRMELTVRPLPGGYTETKDWSFPGPAGSRLQSGILLMIIRFSREI